MGSTARSHIFPRGVGRDAVQVLNLSGGSTATLRLPAKAAPNIGVRVHNLHLAGWLSTWTFGSNPRDG
jgi:hypothetical protein